nr:uncharacterized protein CI109_007363 [Kwoniella shandongensis]KAA5524316.1 hypothetical protein CI109_007363 [Kwoniella shandongensis]
MSDQPCDTKDLVELLKRMTKIAQGISDGYQRMIDSTNAATSMGMKLFIEGRREEAKQREEAQQALSKEVKRSKRGAVVRPTQRVPAGKDGKGSAGQKRRRTSPRLSDQAKKQP